MPVSSEPFFATKSASPGLLSGKSSDITGNDMEVKPRTERPTQIPHMRHSANQSWIGFDPIKETCIRAHKPLWHKGKLGNIFLLNNCPNLFAILKYIWKKCGTKLYLGARCCACRTRLPRVAPKAAGPDPSVHSRCAQLCSGPAPEIDLVMLLGGSCRMIL